MMYGLPGVATMRPQPELLLAVPTPSVLLMLAASMSMSRMPPVFM